MSCASKFFLLVVLCLSVLPNCNAQETTRDTIPLSELSDTLDQEKVNLFLSKIDKEMAKLAEQYPQLADWNVIKKDGPWWEPGKRIRINQRSLRYSHGLSKPIPGSSYEDQFGPNACAIGIQVLTRKEFSRLAGMGIGTVIFGEPFPGGVVTAEFRSGNPKAPELEKKFIEIVRKHLAAAVKE